MRSPVKFSALPPIQRRPVELSSGDVVEVRGLSLNDLMFIVQDMGPVFAETFGTLVTLAQQKKLTNDNVRDALVTVINSSPDLAVRILAAANDDPTPEAMDAIRHLPVLDQALLILLVGEESLRSEAQLKKLQEPLAIIAPVILGALASAKTTPRTRASGIGGSAGRRVS